jgi:hypothetical protein
MSLRKFAIWFVYILDGDPCVATMYSPEGGYQHFGGPPASIVRVDYA